LLFHQRQLRRRDKKEAALLAPVELVSPCILPCILAGEENVAPREEEEEEEKVENALKIFFLLLWFSPTIESHCKVRWPRRF
jgi:hypothetical protein